MTDREKLIELLESAESAVYWNSEDKGFIQKIADHLLANGVRLETEQATSDENNRWIPVSEPPKERECYFVTVKHWLDGKPVTREAYWNGADWLSCDKRHELTPRVTHWMPLPEPPMEV